MKEALIIFAKNPILGHSKTRLASTIGDSAALQIYEQLLEHTFEITSDLQIDKFIFYSTQIADGDIWNDELYSKALQNGSDLGDRMKNALALLFEKSYERIVLIGTDCPELNRAIIKDAFKALKMYEVVLGPAHDGGYYLIGMHEPQPTLFENINWSTETVLSETTKKCKTSGMTFQLLPTLHDLDDEKDLHYFQNTRLLFLPNIVSK